MKAENILRELYHAAIKAADPAETVQAYTNNILSTHAHYGFKRTLLLAVGKAAPNMAKALLDSTGSIVDEGILITKHGHMAGFNLEQYPQIETYEAGHPMPDDEGIMASTRVLDMLQSKGGPDTLIICLLSGGASALMCAPAAGVSMREKQDVTSSLLLSGADIAEINTVRKHLSAIKGGRLMETAYPSRVISLIVSDVPGDDPGVIASGPTAPDTTNATHALAVLDKYGITPPATVLAHLLSTQRGLIADTPDENSPIFENAENVILLNNRTALEGALNKTVAFSLEAEILNDNLQGDVGKAALWLAPRSAEKLKSEHLPICLICGGETTVQVKGKGQGGRNMELALRFALELEGLAGIAMLSAGTDGTDGITEAAGAIITSRTIQQARAKGIDPEQYLEDNDSYNFFKTAGGLFVTGPTGTNVMDIQLILVGI